MYWTQTYINNVFVLSKSVVHMNQIKQKSIGCGKGLFQVELQTMLWVNLTGNLILNKFFNPFLQLDSLTNQLVKC